MPATSGPTERSFSAQGRVHSKTSNRLLTSRAAKLTYIAFNATILLRKPNNKVDVILKNPETVHQKDKDDIVTVTVTQSWKLIVIQMIMPQNVVPITCKNQ